MPSLIGLFTRAYNGVNKHLARTAIPWLVKFDPREADVIRLGSGDGAWMVPAHLSGPGRILPLRRRRR